MWLALIVAQNAWAPELTAARPFERRCTAARLAFSLQAPAGGDRSRQWISGSIAEVLPPDDPRRRP
jgi:hypothetical protein